MSDMWLNPAPPVPLDFDQIQIGSFLLPSLSEVRTDKASKTPTSSKQQTNGCLPYAAQNEPSASQITGLKDQKELTLQENLELFISRFVPEFLSSTGLLKLHSVPTDFQLAFVLGKT